MAEVTKADPETETPSEDESVSSQEEAAEEIEEAQESVDELRDRIRKLEANSTKSGRQHARELETLKKDLDTKDKALSKAIEDNRKWIQRELERTDITNEARRSLEAALGTSEKPSAKATAERDMWRAIATEENQKVRAALVRRAERGRFLTADEIEDLKSDLLDEDEEPKPKRPAPRVNGVRTAGTVTRTADSQIKESKQSKDLGGLWEGMVEKARAEAQIRRSG